VMDPHAIAKLQSLEQARNYVEEWIGKVAEMVRTAPPPPTNNLEAAAYLVWRNRLMITHGQAIGALCALQVFGIIPVPMFQELKLKIIGTVLRKSADVQLGIDPWQ